jgi:regulator of RNase E activity RraB
MEGKWTFTITRFPRDTKEEEPNFNRIETFFLDFEVTQKNNFLIVKRDEDSRLGVLAFMNDVWTLKLADADDNGVVNLVPKLKADYTSWTGNYVESGFNTNNAKQRQNVAVIEFTKQTECYCCPHC